MLPNHWPGSDVIPSPCSGPLRDAAQRKQVFGFLFCLFGFCFGAHWVFLRLLHFIAKGFSNIDTIPHPIFLCFLSFFTCNLLFITKTFWQLEGVRFIYCVSSIFTCQDKHFTKLFYSLRRELLLLFNIKTNNG